MGSPIVPPAALSGLLYFQKVMRQMARDSLKRHLAAPLRLCSLAARASARPVPILTPLAFARRQAQHHPMTPARKHEPTAGARRAARAIERDASLLRSLPELIDRETGVREILELLENIIAEAGDLIESRSPELVAAARAALRRYADDAHRHAE
jgi:hypothetical protein